MRNLNKLPVYSESESSDQQSTEMAKALPQETTELREIFNKYDTNGDGFLDASEVKSIIDSYQPDSGLRCQPSSMTASSSSGSGNNSSGNNNRLSPQKAQKADRRGSSASSNSGSSAIIHPPPSVEDVLEMFKNAGIENDVVTYDQFVIIIHHVNETDASIRQQFDFFDTDRSGKISKKELKSGLKKLKADYRKKIVKNMMSEADLDGDGEIDFEEFKAILAS